MTTNNGLNKCALLQENVKSKLQCIKKPNTYFQLITQFTLCTVSLHHNVLAQGPMALLVVQVLPMNISYHPDKTCHNKVLS